MDIIEVNGKNVELEYCDFCGEKIAKVAYENTRSGHIYCSRTCATAHAVYISEIDREIERRLAAICN